MENKNFVLAPKHLPEVIDLGSILKNQLKELPEEYNQVIVETAGFIPLEVKFKQMEQAGYRAQFFQSEFTSHDVTDMYLNHPEFDITPEDDIEEALVKMELRRNYIESVKNEVRKRNSVAQREENDESVAKVGKKTASEGKNVKDEVNGD